MGTRYQQGHSDLFLVRVWVEGAGDGSGRVEWCGKVQRVVDGESHRFVGWQDLVDLLVAMLSKNKGRY